MEKIKVMRISRHPSPIEITRDQTQLQNVKYFSCLGSLITNDATCTREITSVIAMAKASFNKKKTLFTSKRDYNSRKQ